MLVLALGGCGGGGARPHARTASPDIPPNGATVRTARCLLWNVLDRSGRQQLITALRGFFTQQLDNGAHVVALPDARAYGIITSYCRLRFARAFLLYRLYGNAIAFGTSRSGGPPAR
jgi:hypothetical protein